MFNLNLNQKTFHTTRCSGNNVIPLGSYTSKWVPTHGQHDPKSIAYMFLYTPQMS